MLLFFSRLGERRNWELEAEIHPLARGAEAGRGGKDTGESEQSEQRQRRPGQGCSTARQYDRT